MGLCSMVAFASTASDTANLSAGEECGILTPAYTHDLGTGVRCSNQYPLGLDTPKSCWQFVMALKVWL